VAIGFKTFGLVVVSIAAGLSCSSDETLVVPSYDQFSSRMVQLSADLNGDRRLDQWTYMDANRPIRGEADIDGDGRVDRWEYFDATAALAYVGSSSLNDGVEDTWTVPAPANGEMQVRRSRRRDRAIDRWEIIRAGVLVRSEEDSNADGRPDKWDRFEGSILREVRLDSTRQRGTPDRRLVYGDRGELSAIEQDDDGDGRFEPLRRPPGVAQGKR